MGGAGECTGGREACDYTVYLVKLSKLGQSLTLLWAQCCVSHILELVGLAFS